MKKCELLSPAGNMEMLKYAVQYGADAVYLAGTRFGARKFATNFDDEQLKYAVKYAHLHGVKVYTTINTLIYESEVNSFVENVKFIHSLGVDAVLVQDLGMIPLIRKLAPNLEIHASTQFHNDGQNTMNFLKELGVKRVVLDREMTIDEIRTLSHTTEIEVFIHGALCVSYSGQCLFSSQVLGRSGNRGECAGLCRLPYKIKTIDKEDSKPAYHLSLKDLNGTESVYDLLDCKVDSLKIEGRMKSPEYTGYMTKIYRSLIDSYYAGTKRKLTTEELTNIRLLFNRGLTEGFLKNAQNDSIVNTLSPNHIGIHLGTYRLFKDKIELTLDEPLSQGDTIRFREDAQGMLVNFLYDSKNKLINEARPGQTVYVDNFLDIQKRGELRLVVKASLLKEISQLPKRTVPVDMHFKASLNEPMKLVIDDDIHHLEVQGLTPSLAVNRPVDENDIKKQLSKTGTTVYRVRTLDIHLENNLFINLKDLNEIRRRALEKLDELRTTPDEPHFEELKKVHVETTEKTPELIVLVSTKEQYFEAKKYTDNIFTTDAELLATYDDIYPKYVRGDEPIADDKYMISHYGSLAANTSNREIYTDYMLNVTNSHTVNAILEKKAKCVTLSVELPDEQITLLAKNVDMSKICILVYGKIELMKMKYDPLKNRGTHLLDRNGSAYLITRDAHYNYLMSSKPIDHTPSIDFYRNLRVGYYRLDFTDETREECAKMLEKVHKFIYKE